MPVKSAYIHIPFCISKCKYCSFVSYTDTEKMTGYLYSLLKEIDYYYQGEILDTLYFGGGTPSVYGYDQLKKIVSKFNLSDSPEVTIEINPNDAKYEYIKNLRDIGFNRISIGAQTFNNDILRIIGRRHNSAEIIDAVEIAKEAGFSNINIDLIYGLPNHTINDFKNDIITASELGVNHISLYGLKIDEGCYFYDNKPQNLPDDDIQADMYILAGDITKKNGFNHYEISNYAKDGFFSRHNTNYWKCGEYYGFGVSAHGYNDGVRYSNYSDITKYIQNPTSREVGKFLTENERLEESVFLGFRLSEGININEINRNFNIDFENKYQKTLEKYLKTGHIEKTENGYKLSDDKSHNGFLISNIILADFI